MQNRLLEGKRQALIRANLDEYGEKTADLAWITPQRALAAEAERTRLLETMETDLAQACKFTKPHIGPLSPGCRICSQGEWSCLFINGRCNCRCFYCPSPQDDISIPTTNRLTFDKADDYADYIRCFGYEGVSISGGEPLFTFERTRSYIKTVRRRSGDGLHIWLYTNGTLVTREVLLQLKGAGLNEIRFDISAVNYDLEKVALAVGLIPCVTIEIPAIPEDFVRLADLLPVIKDLGVDHLNLHQLRLTPHNRERLKGRGYTYLHGEKVTVLESELTALKLLCHAHAKRIGLPINYCSFVYKNRYQAMSVRRRHAGHVVKGHESVTESGYIRSLALCGKPDVISAQARHLETVPAASQRWLLSGRKDRLYFHAALWPNVDLRAGDLTVGYSQAVLNNHLSYGHLFKELRINPKNKLYIEKQPCLKDLELGGDLQLHFARDILNGGTETVAVLPPELEAIIDYERIRSGLQDYF